MCEYCDVNFVDCSDNTRFLDKDIKVEGCQYNFASAIVGIAFERGDGYYSLICSVFDANGSTWAYSKTRINYCPLCGRELKLSPEEAKSLRQYEIREQEITEEAKRENILSHRQKMVRPIMRFVKRKLNHRI